MTFEQLDYFIRTVESETFFDAAESLHITQSTLSKQIMKLERELNIKLFDRSKRSATVTEAGQLFYKEAIKLSSQYHEMLSRMTQFHLQTNLQLHLGTLPILTQYNLTPLLRNFAEQNKDISFSLDDVEEKELLLGFAQNRFDLIIARANMLDLMNCHFYPLANDRLTVIVPSRHRFSQKSSISLEELAYESFILMPSYTSIHQLCKNLFENFHISPTIIRTARMESIISAVAIGEGISLLPEQNFKLFQSKNVVAIPLKQSPTLSIGIAQKKSIPPSASAIRFLEYITKTSEICVFPERP